LNTPETVGVPDRVMEFEVQLAVTPVGNPTAIPIPVAPVVEIVSGLSGELMQTTGLEEGGAAVLVEVTVCAPDNTEAELPQEEEDWITT
jgi:hypothetical protein